MKSKYVAALLAFFLGGLGAHKFYLGKTLAGILYLIFFWTYIPAIISFIECILFLVNSEDDFNRKYNKDKTVQNHQQPEITYPSNNFKPIEYKTEKICTSCGKINDLDSNFCESCGRKL